MYQNSHLGFPECWEAHSGLVSSSSPLEHMPVQVEKQVQQGQACCSKPPEVGHSVLYPP